MQASHKHHHVPSTWLVWTEESTGAIAGTAGATGGIGHRPVTWEKCRRRPATAAGRRRGGSSSLARTGNMISANSGVMVDPTSPTVQEKNTNIRSWIQSDGTESIEVLEIPAEQQQQSLQRESSPAPIRPSGPSAKINALKSLSRASLKRKSTSISGAVMKPPKSLSAARGKSKSKSQSFLRNKNETSAATAAAAAEVQNTSFGVKSAAASPSATAATSRQKSTSRRGNSNRRSVSFYSSQNQRMKQQNPVKMRLHKARQEKANLARIRLEAKRKEELEAATQREGHLAYCAVKLQVKRDSQSRSQSRRSSFARSSAGGSAFGSKLASTNTSRGNSPTQCGGGQGGGQRGWSPEATARIAFHGLDYHERKAILKAEKAQEVAAEEVVSVAAEPIVEQSICDAVVLDDNADVEIVSVPKEAAASDRAVVLDEATSSNLPSAVVVKSKKNSSRFASRAGKFILASAVATSAAAGGVIVFGNEKQKKQLFSTAESASKYLRRGVDYILASTSAVKEDYVVRFLQNSNLM